MSLFPAMDRADALHIGRDEIEVDRRRLTGWTWWLRYEGQDEDTDALEIGPIYPDPQDWAHVAMLGKNAVCSGYDIEREDVTIYIHHGGYTPIQRVEAN